MNNFYKIFKLSGGMCFTNEISGQDLVEMANNIRDWDKKECDVYGGRLDELLPGRYGKVYNEKDNSLIGVWSSHQYTDCPECACWGWLTTKAVENHKLDFVRSAKECVKAWWQCEKPCVKCAFITVIEGHRQAEEYLNRFVGSSLCFRVKDTEICGIKHSVWRFNRPYGIKNIFNEVDDKEYFLKYYSDNFNYNEYKKGV